MKFTFVAEYSDGLYESDYSKIEHTFEGETLDRVLEHFTSFLQGAGYGWVQPGSIVHNPEAE
jgi:hypothetical protein